MNLVRDLGIPKKFSQTRCGLGRGAQRLSCRHGCGSLPRATWQLDHAWVSADCPPTVGGSVFEVRLLGPVRAVRLAGFRDSYAEPLTGPDSMVVGIK